ncbi:hypothetical protein TW83_17610 [Paracoccus sp. S4493]|nr:hypothetical protein TW83_17610 [Paracoccus sp. S4493]
MFRDASRKNVLSLHKFVVQISTAFNLFINAKIMKFTINAQEIDRYLYPIYHLFKQNRPARRRQLCEILRRPNGLDVLRSNSVDRFSYHRIAGYFNKTMDIIIIVRAGVFYAMAKLRTKLFSHHIFIAANYYLIYSCKAKT